MSLSRERANAELGSRLPRLRATPRLSARRSDRSALGLLLQRLVIGATRRVRSSRPLLDSMSKLVRDQRIACRRTWTVLAGTERDIVGNGESARTKLPKFG